MPNEVPTSWNPLDNSDATLFFTANTASFQTTPNTFHSVRSNTSKSSGRWMFVTQPTSIDAVGGLAVGVANRQANLFTICGNDNNSAGFQFLTNAKQSILNNTTKQIFPLDVLMRDYIGICVDIDAGLVWWNDLKQRSGWTNVAKGDFSGDPTNRVGGAKLGFNTTIGTFIMASGYFGFETPDTIVLNPQCFGFTNVIPSLFSSWDELTTGFTVAQPC